ncbi:DEAD/DEAH box helicase [Dokdonella sp.]|uniref:DEAD/DEAH box helicase n=1 Tax=Dokdonella sp. TaxID=2291710 RepID=UPI001B1AE41B|nr:DEAD/DEAH box helicase [Dokdonella sp.]MBO9663328.1 DEAD/DEAH box helicase [Dokdonella sp.]
MSFETLGLAPALLRALAEQGYDQPTPIQAAAIPAALEGRDLLAGAQTGTGKTAAFALPLLHRLYAAGRTTTQPKTPRALVLTPTRELAAQVHDSVRAYGKHLGVRATTIFGGVGIKPQVDALRRGVDVLIATPGRLIDHIQQRSVNLSHIEVLILDEADRMLDMGFLPSIKRILGHLPRQQRITWLFSATFAPEIKALAGEFMREPVEIQVAKPNSVATTVTHRVHPVDADKKRDLLLHLLQNDARQTLVFGRTKHGADKLAKILEKSGLRAAAIHGNKSQNQRTRALADFKSGKINVLVATDIAARGLDIDQLPMVINHDLPMVAEDYVHRIGRTGRAGAEGLAISLVSHEEEGLLRDIRRLLKQEIEIASVAGFEPSRPLRADGTARPTQKPSGGRPQRHARRPHASNGNEANPEARKKKPRRRGGRGRQSRPA